MRKTLELCLLILLLTGSASAGIMGNDTPEPPKATVIEEPTGGEMHTDGTASGEADSLTEATLELLALLPSLLY